MTKVKINFWADEDLKKKIERQAKKEERTTSSLLRSKIKEIKGIEKW